jgi:serine/threonine-protein kinase
MYCPKCNEIFEEGSRRFCPNDGARLVSGAAEAAARRSAGGIFANLMPKTDLSRELDESIPEVPQFFITEPEFSEPETVIEVTGDFFVLEEVEPENVLEPIIDTSERSEPAESKPAARKVKPYEIPAGHVDLKKSSRPFGSTDFKVDNPESFIGRTVKGRYYVTELLGGDETSFAFLAYDKIFRDKTVLVRILPAQENDETTAGIMEDELVALSHVSHPNVARLIDSGQFKDRTRFLISEYVDALSVNDILTIHGTIDGLRSARIIKQVAYALNEVHQEGIIHRDLRPENIIVASGDSETQHAILVNFGASNGEANQHNIGYKAPEVFDGRYSTISGDIFSLAVIAYEMLTGALPFTGPTSRAMVRSQYAGPERFPSQVKHGLPREVDAVLKKALAFKVSDRYVKARDFGDAFYTGLAEAPAVEISREEQAVIDKKTARLAVPVPPADEPAWKNRSPEPPQVENSRSKAIAASAILGLLAVLALGWYYVSQNQPVVDAPPANNIDAVPVAGNPAPKTGAAIEMPPLPRNIPQPPNTSFYQNSKQNLKGDLIRNFIGFTLYYPKDWKLNGPQESSTANGRGKFLDISRLTPEGRLKEQMLVSYYSSKGTYKDDASKFPQLVKETNETLKNLLPGYLMVSEGETKINGDWRAYEVKFHATGKSETGEQITVWGRRLFIPAARPNVRSGFEITMLATSAAENVRSVDDVGVKGELASILYSFEPSQNF